MRQRQLSTVAPAYQQQVLFVLRAADFQSTADQAFTKLFAGTNYIMTGAYGKRVSGGSTVVCAGGIYTAASKAGSALVAAVQSWIGLSGAGKIASATLAAVVGTDVQTATPILSLTTGSTAAITADVFILGFVAD